MEGLDDPPETLKVLIVSKASKDFEGSHATFFVSALILELV